ncbi:MAG: RDD family protein [Pseudomonadota bacterium]
MTDHTWHLPDPVTQPEFYSDVPSKRAIAWVIDSVLVLILCVVILPFTAFTALFFFPALWWMVSFIYRVATIARGSATLGMLVMSIEFRTHQGDRFDLAMALKHTAGYSFSLLFIIFQLISVITILSTQRRQSLVDLALGTVAINQRAGG